MHAVWLTCPSGGVATSIHTAALVAPQSYAAAASLRSSLAVRVCAYVLSAHRTRELTTRGLVPLLGSHRVSFVPLWEVRGC